MNKNCLFLCTLGVFLLCSCDSNKPKVPTIIDVSATVKEKDTNIPLEGLMVTIQTTGGNGLLGSYDVVASTQTDVNGYFSLHYETYYPQTVALVQINSKPWNSNFDAPLYPVNYDSRKNTLYSTNPPIIYLPRLKP